VIAITLNFKSIEAARQVLLEIPASALVAGPAPEAEAPKPVQAQEPAPGQATAKADAAPKKTAAAKTQPAASAEAQQPASTAATEGNAAAASSAPEATAAPAASSIDYATLQKAVFALAGKSRESAAQVAGSFGVKTFKELPQDKWGDALAAVQEKLAELENV
jgi:hypothetical protein